MFRCCFCPSCYVSAVQRLHANHEQPRNAFTKYDNGWMLFFKQATTSYSSPNSAAAAGPTGGANAASIAAGAAATYAAFMAVCFRPLDHLQAQQQLRASGAAPIAVSNPFGNPAPISSGSGSAAAAQGAFNPWWQQQQQQQQQQRPAVPQVVASGSGSVPTSPTGFLSSPMSPFTQQQQYQHAGLSMQPAGAPPQAAQQRPPGQQQQQWPQDVMHAQPGETDEQFARRLAVMMGGGSGSNSNSSSPNSSGRLPSAGLMVPNSRLGSSSSQQLLQTQQQQQQGLYPSLSAPSGGITGDFDGPPPSAPPAAAGLPLTSANPFRPAAAAATASAAAAGPQQQQGLAPGVAAVAATAAGVQLQAGSIAGAQQMPAVPGSSASAAAAGATGGSESAADQDLCVICLSEPREVGFLHGASVHKCVCRECASLMQPHAPCPMCRQPIERIIGVY
jgi:hypothetical protein